MLMGYMRVSKSDGAQTLDRQWDACLAAGGAPERLYEERASGRQDDRPGLTACLKALQPGKPLVVWQLERLGRTLTHLISVVEALGQRHVGFKVLAGVGAQIETPTAHGRVVFGIFAALAECEAALMRERPYAGLAAARACGRLGGRPRKMTKATQRMARAARADPQSKASEGARRWGMTTTTLYEDVHGDGALKPRRRTFLAKAD